MNDERKGATSASNAQADLLCAGRHLAQRGIPDQLSQDAAFGREIHRALQTNDGSKLSPEQYSIFEAIQRIETAKVAQFFGGAVPTVVREQRFWAKIKRGDQEFEHSGQPDVVYRAGTRALIFEYKALVGDLPEASSNQQLRDQVVLVYGNVPLLSEIGAAVIQPLVTGEPELCLYAKEHIVRAEQEMFARVALSNDPSSPRTPGEVQCKFCKARHQCVEYQKWASSMLPMLNVLDVPVSAWTPEQCALFCDRKSVAQKWLDDCVDQVKLRLQKDPGCVPGWTLKPGRLMEEIEDPQKVFERFSTLGGKLETFMDCIKVGKSKLKEAVSKVTGHKGKALDSSMKEILDGVTSSKRTADLLVKADGKETDK